MMANTVLVNGHNNTDNIPIKLLDLPFESLLFLSACQPINPPPSALCVALPDEIDGTKGKNNQLDTC